MLPAKAQLWAFMAEGLGQPRELASAPAIVRHGLNFAMVLCTTLVPMLLGSNRFMSFFTVICGTAANWTNLFLPAFVVVYVRIRPARSARTSWKGAGAAFLAISAVAVAAAIEAGSEIMALFQPVIALVP